VNGAVIVGFDSAKIDDYVVDLNTSMSKLVNDAFHKAIVCGDPRNRSRRVRIRLRGRRLDRTAMQCCKSMHCSSHGHHSQDCCKTCRRCTLLLCSLICVWRIVLARRIRSDGSISGIPCLRLSCSHRRCPLPRSARLPLIGCTAFFASSLTSSRFSAVRVRVLGIIVVFAGGETREISESYWVRERPVAGARRITLCFNSRRARTCT
jgi:hypothetical protein